MAKKIKEPMESKPKQHPPQYQTSILQSNFATNIISLLSLAIAVIALIQGFQSSRPKVILNDSRLKEVREFYNFDPDRYPNQTRYVCRVAITLTSINERNTALTGYDVVVKYKDDKLLLPDRHSGLTYNENWGSGKDTFPGFDDFLSILVLPELPIGAWHNQDPLTGNLESMPDLPIIIRDTMTFLWDVEIFREINSVNFIPDANQVTNLDTEKLLLRFTLNFANKQKIVLLEDITCIE